MATPESASTGKLPPTPNRCDRGCVYAVTVRTSCSGPATPRAAAQIRQLLWAVSAPRDSLQHVYVQPSPYGADLVMFLVASDLATAEDVAARLITRAQRAGLIGCTPVTCEVELVLPFAEAALPPDSSVAGTDQ